MSGSSSTISTGLFIFELRGALTSCAFGVCARGFRSAKTVCKSSCETNVGRGGRGCKCACARVRTKGGGSMSEDESRSDIGEGRAGEGQTQLSEEEMRDRKS